MAYMGTTVVYGRGRAVVAATGMTTEMGKIATMLQEVEREPTPLQRRLAEFGRFLVYLAGGICTLIFFLGVFRGDDVLEMFLTAVSLAVAAIPEGLPAVVTIVLALGVQRMVRRHALIRKLPSVETLGAATIVASDKTGTLTQNQMTVKKVFLSTGERLNVTGSGYEPLGEFFEESREVRPVENPVLVRALKIAVLCNSSELKKGPGGAWQVIGDPTEGALLSLARKAGLTKEELTRGLKFTGEVPFDAERKMMTTVYEGPHASYAFIKGAPERILSLSTGLLREGISKPLTKEETRKILDVNEEFARGALRVLALAYRESKGPLDVHSPHTLEKDLTFVGLVGMIDPPRDEVFVAVEKAKTAGITPIMITGDHRMTAVAIAKEVGAFDHGDVDVTGEELDRMSDEEFKEKLPHIRVYARVNPVHKLKVVRAWRERGEIIAMTGDGVNDAPALKEADIGVSMGITGTDVTKEASDMVLTDDNFASIVSAVEEGRGIFDNIRRVVHFLLSGNIGEILVLLLASLTGMPLPLLPVQILWTNLVTDGLPALGLAMEPVDPDVMDRKPRPKTEGIVTRSIMWVMALQGVFMALVTLAVYWLELNYFESGLEKARTMAFTVLVFCQKFHVFNCRSEKESVFRLGPFTNRLLNLSVGVILVTQVGLVYIPALQPVFKVVSLGLSDWALVFAASVQPLIWMEIVKWGRKMA
jgi:Ca2+-transporting ATPase